MENSTVETEQPAVTKSSSQKKRLHSDVSPSYSKLAALSTKPFEKKAKVDQMVEDMMSSPEPESEKTNDTKEETKKESGYSKSGHSSDEGEVPMIEPDSSFADFYCRVCDAHANSPQMWESHIGGKRHIKNARKYGKEGPEPAVTVKEEAIIQHELWKIEGPIVGLQYVCETQKADPSLKPTYNCFMCSACMQTGKNLIEHLRSTKHRLAYIKEKDPSAYKIYDNLSVRKHELLALVEDKVRILEEENGRGLVIVKKEKPRPVLVQKKPDAPTNPLLSADAVIWEPMPGSGSQGMWPPGVVPNCSSFIPRKKTEGEALADFVMKLTTLPDKKFLDIVWHKFHGYEVKNDTEMEHLQQIQMEINRSLLNYKMIRNPPMEHNNVRNRYPDRPMHLLPYQPVEYPTYERRPEMDMPSGLSNEGSRFPDWGDHRFMPGGGFWKSAGY